MLPHPDLVRGTLGTPYHPDLVRGGGVSHPDLVRGYPPAPTIQTWLGGYPIQTWSGGYPRLGPGGVPRVPPCPDLGWGTPYQDLRWGTPLPRPEMGYPPPRNGGQRENITFRHLSDAGGNKEVMPFIHMSTK